MKGQQTKSMIVKADIADAYRQWADIERFPSFMQHIQSVEKTGETTSHWVMRGPLGKTISWDAETTRMEEDRRIAWNSTRGDIETSGQVTFTELPHGETEVTLTQHFEAGRLREMAADFFDDPDAILVQMLRDFKAHVESQAQRRAA